MFKQERLAPWTRAGAPDLDYDDRFRAATHALLTHPDLLTYFRSSRRAKPTRATTR